MRLTKITSVPFLLLLLAMLTSVASAWAITPDREGWLHTGDGTRVKKIVFASINVYDIGHDMKCMPLSKAKQVIIDTDCDKKFTWTMKRDVDAEKIRNALTEAYAMNGYKDSAKIAPFLAAVNHELKTGTKVIISYNAANKTTSIAVGGGGGNASVAGPEFMKATWSIWFGKIDQPDLSDALLKNL